MKVDKQNFQYAFSSKIIKLPLPPSILLNYPHPQFTVIFWKILYKNLGPARTIFENSEKKACKLKSIFSFNFYPPKHWKKITTKFK